MHLVNSPVDQGRSEWKYYFREIIDYLSQVKILFWPASVKNALLCECYQWCNIVEGETSNFAIRDQGFYEYGAT